MRFSPISFEKWHALGNSYLLLERAELGRALEPELAMRLCDVRYGIGADGVLEVVSAGGQRAEIAIWNPDGSRAEFSGNGTRIAAAWLLRNGGDEVTVRVSGRDYPAARSGEEIALEVGAVDVSDPETVVAHGEEIELTRVSVGNPHAVVRREPQREELLRLGPLLERHERFPERTNVQLVRIDGSHAISALVWERGAGETSASGSQRGRRRRSGGRERLVREPGDRAHARRRPRRHARGRAGDADGACRTDLRRRGDAVKGSSGWT